MDEGVNADVGPRDSRSKKALLVVSLVAVATVSAGLYYWWYRSVHISTDDAFVDGRIHMVAARIQGKVVELLVDDDQHVKAGQPLLKVDPEPYDVRQAGAAAALAAAQADLAAAEKDLAAGRAELVQKRASVEAARAHLDLARAQLEQAERNSARSLALFERKTISKEQNEKTLTDEKVARAGADLAREELRLSEAGLPVQAAVVAQREARISQQQAVAREREASLAEAKLNRGYTIVEAPADGFITRRSVEVGQVVSPGQALLAVASLVDVWVVANYKETEIERIRPGLPVLVEVDTYPGKTFHGKVASLMAGTGSAFSLFPPENATGNYVKVVQRVPVKIVLDGGEDPAHVLRIGMSVVPTVITH